MTSIQNPYLLYTTPKTDTTTIIIPNTSPKPVPRTSPPTTLNFTKSTSFPNDLRTPRKKHPSFGPYILGSTLGEGEFGKVKLGWTKNGNISGNSMVGTEVSKQVAIKLIKKETFANDSRKEAKIFREINALKQLHHPNIVKLEEVLQNSKYIGIVLEYASCGEFYKYIQRKRRLKENVACRLFAQLISGVTYIHSKGLVHRDLKLENLLLDKHENLIITDFGFVNEFHSPDALMKTSCGSPCYAAPELVSGVVPYEARKADVWSCGVILFAMLAGYLPWDDDIENLEGDNIGRLYYYITHTPLKFPEYITPLPRNLLRRILVADPTKRVESAYIVKHPWLAPHSPFLSITSAEWDKIAQSKKVLKLPKHFSKHNSLNISTFGNYGTSNNYRYDHAIHSNSSSINSIDSLNSANDKNGITLNHFIYSKHNRGESGSGSGTRPVSLFPMSSSSNSRMDKCDSLVIDSTLNLSPVPPRESQSHVISIPSTPKRDLVTSPIRGHSRNNSAASLALQAVVNADREMFNLQLNENSGYGGNNHRVSSQQSRRSQSQASVIYGRNQRSSEHYSRNSNVSNRDISPLQKYGNLLNVPKLTLNTLQFGETESSEAGYLDRSMTKSPSSIVRHDFIGTTSTELTVTSVSASSSSGSSSSSTSNFQYPPLRTRQPPNHRKPRPTSYHPTLFSTPTGNNNNNNSDDNNNSSYTSLTAQKHSLQHQHQHQTSQYDPTSRPERRSTLYSLSETPDLFDSLPTLASNSNNNSKSSSINIGSSSNSSSSSSTQSTNGDYAPFVKSQSLNNTRVNPTLGQRDEHCLRIIDTSESSLNKRGLTVLSHRSAQSWLPRRYSYTRQQPTRYPNTGIYYAEDNKENVDISGDYSTSVEKLNEIDRDRVDEDPDNGDDTLIAINERSPVRENVEDNDKKQTVVDDFGYEKQEYQPSTAKRVLNFFKTRSIKL